MTASAARRTVSRKLAGIPVVRALSPGRKGWLVMRNFSNVGARLLALGMVAGLSVVVLAADEPTRSVFITAGSFEPPPGDEKALAAKLNDADKARKDLEKQLKTQFGKKRETWPPEKEEELYALEEAQAVANVGYAYRKVDAKKIPDAVKDLTRAAEGKGMQAGKKKHITLATSAADADLLVEVLARRNETGGAALSATDCWVLISVGAGGKTDKVRFAKIPTTYRAKTGLGLVAYKIAGPTAARPAFVFEGYNANHTSFGCHGAAANAASSVVDKFIEDNHALLGPK